MRIQPLLAIISLSLTIGGVARAQSTPAPTPPPTADQGPTVLGRGPVHEAFAQPAARDPEATPVLPRQPPAPIQELPPTEKPADPSAIWIPGYWQWDVSRKDFIWVSGVWRVPPPGQQWVPGYWHQAGNGFQWVPGLWTAAGQQSIPYTAPPPASLEVGPSAPAPDADHFYVPGCWMDRDTGYAWRPGYWTPGHEDWVWQPSHYAWTPGGCVFVAGFWDRPLDERGLLFAPVAFDQPLWQNAGWSYTPSYVVDPTALLDCLFYQPGWGNYCFGDYYNPYFTQTCGFQPWWGYGRPYYDPLFSYYGWRHRFDRGWGGGLRSNYYARLGGRLGVPPATWGAQRALAHAGRGGGRLASAGLLRPLGRTAGLRRLDAGQRRMHLEAAQRYQHLGQNRSRSEAVRHAPARRVQAARYNTRQPTSGGSRYAGYFGRGVEPFRPLDQAARSRAWESSGRSRNVEPYRGRSLAGREFTRMPDRSRLHQLLAEPRSNSGSRAVWSEAGSRSGPAHASPPPSSPRHSAPRSAFDPGRSAGPSHQSARPSSGGHSGGSHSSGGHGGGHSGSSRSSGGHGGGHHR